MEGILMSLLPLRSQDKKLWYFEVMLNLFEFSQVWENVESWLVYANKLLWISQPRMTEQNKVSVSFLFLLLRLLMKKIKFLIKFYYFNCYNLSIL